jgi:hypothetical protein
MLILCRISTRFLSKLMAKWSIKCIWKVVTQTTFSGKNEKDNEQCLDDTSSSFF